MVKSKPKTSVCNKMVGDEEADLIDSVAEKLGLTDDEEDDVEYSTRIEITKELCDEINELHSNGYTYREISEELGGISLGAISKHVNGECDHSKRHNVTRSECGWIRYHAEKGTSRNELAEKHDITPDKVSEHAYGKCNHPEVPEPLDPEDTEW